MKTERRCQVMSVFRESPLSIRVSVSSAPNYVLSLTHSIHIQMKISRSIYPHLILDIYGSGLDQHAIRSSMPS